MTNGMLTRENIIPSTKKREAWNKKKINEQKEKTINSIVLTCLLTEVYKVTYQNHELKWDMSSGEDKTHR